MRRELNVAVVAGVLLGGVVGCNHDQPDMSKTNRLNPETSTGNSQQATEPPTNPNRSMPPDSSPMRP